MSDFPQTRHELIRAGYVRLDNGGKLCHGCDAPIEWWKTTRGKKIPMNPMPEDRSSAQAHFAICPNARDFRGGDTSQPAPAAKQPASRPSIESEIRALRQKYDARVVLLIDDLGTTAYWRGGIPAEDLRHDLISAGNFVRGEVQKIEATR
jgi:hypothetical protein